MGCVLRASGKHFNVDEYLRNSALQTYYAYRKGEPRFKSNPGGEKKRTTGINIVICNGSFDSLARQIRAAISFLKNNRTEIRRLVKFLGLDGAPVLDFGINKRDFPGQFDRFPVELVSLAGKLGLGIELSQYDFGKRPALNKSLKRDAAKDRRAP
jgi:hypothetical protein